MAAPASLAEGLGTVTPSFEGGDLFLTNADGFAFRLSWTGDEETDERARALPAGEYVLKTYRVLREDDDAQWHISATSPAIQKIEVSAGANTEVEIDDAIRIRSHLNGGRAQMMIQGEHGAGLSIYRDGKRIPIDFRVVDDDGSVITSGHMRYG
jgi:hypothetical protein